MQVQKYKFFRRNRDRKSTNYSYLCAFFFQKEKKSEQYTFFLVINIKQQLLTNMSKQIRFCLVYRDMWQSSGKYQPRVDQLVRVAPAIIDCGCFARVETNGGAFEQVNLLYGENPNKAVRAWTKPLREAGIQCQMLERALNALRMDPVPADVRRLMFKVKKAQGVDIARSFCGLNDPRNLENSVKFAKEAGMISQVALSITHSDIHTVEYYMGVVDKVVEFGCDEIGLKDMAGVGRPATLGRLVKAIKEKYPHILVQYHGHTGPGFSVASTLEVCKAGADIIDVAVEPLSWGMVHPDVITIQAMLKDAGFDVPEINMNAYMEVRRLTQEFMDDFLGYWIDPKNRISTSLLVGCGLPGGMMGSMMADLKGVHKAINMSLKASGNKELSEDELLVKLFEEVAYVWPKVGNPPLVTPFSQYVKNIALMNILQMAQGKERFSNMDQKQWDMILGKAGTLPGTLAPEIVELAKEKGYEFSTTNPQDNYPDELPKYRKLMEEKGWDVGEDEEELFEYAMHPTQYIDYKSGAAKKNFERELEAKKQQSNIKVIVKEIKLPEVVREELIAAVTAQHPDAKPVISTSDGIVLWEVPVTGQGMNPPMGTSYKEGDTVCFVEAYYGQDEVKALYDGKLLQVVVKQGERVRKGDVIAFLN